MHVDFMTLACLKQDLDTLQGAKIQQLLFTNENSVAFELYAGSRKTLLLDMSSQHSRAWLQTEKARRGVENPTPLLLLLRKYVRRGRLRSVTQPPWERILRFEIESQAGRSTLVAEIMGRYSNLLLLNDKNIVMECLRRAGAQKNQYRVTLPNQPYQTPPPVSKNPPTALQVGDWQRILASHDAQEPLYRVLIRLLAGVSPTVARELSFRVTGNTNGTVKEAQAASLHRITQDFFAVLQTGEWQPHVAFDEEGRVATFAAYELTHFAHREAVNTISEAMQRYFAAKIDHDAYASARKDIADILAKAKKEVNSRLYQLRSQTIDKIKLEKLRENGELLLAYQWQVPKQATEVELPDFEGNPRQIKLDGTLTPLENAQRLFKRYEKKKRAADEVPPRIEAAERDLVYLQQMDSDLELAEERPEIEAVHRHLEAAGFIKKKRKRTGNSPVRGPRQLLLDEWMVLVGRNSRQNDEVTFRHGGANDLWFHARGVPGSHVILKSAGRKVPQEIIEQAASLAAYYSKARGNNRAEVIMTERKHVRRVPGGHPGLVTCRNESTLHVAPMSVEEMEERIV